jgi:subtilisin family serine protease
MKFFRFSLLSALLCGGASIAHSAPVPAEFAPGEILVKVAPARSAALSRFSASSGGSTIRTYPRVGWQRVKLPANLSIADALKVYTKQAGVTAVEPNYKVKAFKTPNDSSYDRLYAMAKISAPAAWDVTTGSSDVVIAVLDTGVKYDHPDLAANMWHNPTEKPNNGKDDDGNGIVDDYYGYDALNLDGNPMDDNGHGTHCAGVIGAVGNNSQGVVGVNWKTKIMALKFLGADGLSFSSGALDAYEYAITQKKRGVNLRVISNSWGGPGKSLAIQSVMQEAADNGIISICAAGNDDTDNDAKATNPSNGNVTGLVSVGASDENDNRASFSNYGKRNVDLFAPGVDIYSTYIGKGANAYTFESGTSMACPHVAGAAALLLAQAPSLGVAEVKTRLLAAVDVLPQLKGLATSSGRLNLAKLLSNGIYSVRGVVTDEAKKPLAGAQIFINGSKTASATSKPDGSYSVDGLKPGTYSATATLRGWTFTASPAKVTLGNKSYVSKINFTGKAAAAVYSITGTVYKLSGTQKTPLKGVMIYLGTDSEPVAVTDGAGKYTINGRSAGTYYIFAKLGGFTFTVVDQLSLDGSAKITLPSKTAAVADFVARVEDSTAPVVTINSPTSGTFYREGELKRAFGTAYDPSGVDGIYYMLSRNLGDGIQYYYWTTKTWSPVFPADDLTEVPEDAFLLQNFDAVSVSWSVDLPALDVGEYQFSVFPFDNLGNLDFYQLSQPFTVGGSGEETNYPAVTITAPTSAKPVLANTSVLAKGRASDSSGIETVFVYLRRFDERGQILSYYDWAEKTWISTTNLDPAVYTRIDGKGAPSVNWSVQLPPMVPGNYEVGAFARDGAGNEPPEDGSADALSPFTVEAGVSGNAKAAAKSGSSNSS